MRISVVMPTYDQEAFLPAAVASLQAQTLTDWELVVVDDGSPGDVRAALGRRSTTPHPARSPGGQRRPRRGAQPRARRDDRRLRRLPAVRRPAARRHLASLAAALDAHPDAALAVAGSASATTGSPARASTTSRCSSCRSCTGGIADERWLEREELTTTTSTACCGSACARTASSRDRRGHLPLGRAPAPAPSRDARARRRPEPLQGRYPVRRPLRFHSTAGHLHDEVELFAAERDRPPTPRAPDGLRILLVGDLAHNPDRILALNERGHELHGLWTDTPHWYNTVGPVPFGHVRDVPRQRWADAVRRLRPDVIYALLNWQSIGMAHRVLDEGLGIPFVWHFKEGPFDARRRGLWPELVDLYTRSDGQISASAEARDWFAAMVPASRDGRSLVLDGDLPRAARLAGDRSALLSSEDGDGEIHTVIPGRPLGPEPAVVARLAERGVHIHLFSGKAQHQWRDWVEEVQRLAPEHVHLHPQVDQERWVETFSRFDAGWLHSFESSNGGDISAATWNDLNVPARMGTLAAAGVPMIQRDNAGSRVAPRPWPATTTSASSTAMPTTSPTSCTTARAWPRCARTRGVPATRSRSTRTPTASSVSCATSSPPRPRARTTARGPCRSSALMAEWSTTSVHESGADPRAVWDRAYADASAYPRWNPELAAASLDGPLRLGATIRIRFRTGLRLRFPVVEFEDGRLFTDEARLPLARMGHRHVIDARPAGGATLTNTIYVRGPLAAFWAGSSADALPPRCPPASARSRPWLVRASGSPGRARGPGRTGRRRGDALEDLWAVEDERLGVAGVQAGADLVPGDRRGDRRAVLRAQRVDVDRRLGVVVLRPVDEDLARPQRLGHPRDDEAGSDCSSSSATALANVLVPRRSRSRRRRR
jgi:hypothetical protein